MQGQGDGTDATLARRFGEELRKRRESLSLDLASLAQSTRINRPFLDALEAGAFERLPGQVFGRGFLRSVGKALNLTPEETVELITSYDACWAPKTQEADCLKVQIKNKPYPAPSERVAGFVKRVVPSKSVFIGALSIMLLAGGGFAGYRAWPRVKQKLVAMTVEGEKPTAKANKKVAAAEVTAAEAPASASVPAAVAEAPAEVPTAVSAAVAPEVPADEPDLATVVAEEPTPAAAPTVTEAPAVVPAGAVSVPVAAEPVASAPIAETAPVPASEAPQVASGSGDQVLELVVTEPVRVRMDMDDGQSQTRELAPQTYRFSFKDQADLLIYDAAALKISFNGRSLGTLGNKGRVRRLSFRAGPPNEQNL